MKCLSVAPEFATAIVRGTKRKEFRGWKPKDPLPLTILIHATRPESCIVGCVDVVEIRGVLGDYGWVLARPRRFRQPIRTPGKLGLWQPDAALEDAIRAQLGPTRPAA
jgi:hypothetical protein